jgi:hypothetical protein
MPEENKTPLQVTPPTVPKTLCAECAQYSEPTDKCAALLLPAPVARREGGGCGPDATLFQEKA